MLYTPRLILRQWRESDLEPFAALSADPRVMRYFPSTLDRSESDALARRCAALIEERGWGLWAVERREDGAFVGLTGLHIPGDSLPCMPCVEVGWRLVFDAWGRGYATEAARASLRFGFEELHLPEIVAFTVPANHRSRAVMERLGMRRDAPTFEHPGLPEGHPLREHCLYRLSRPDWLSGNGPAEHAEHTPKSPDRRTDPETAVMLHDVPRCLK